jgi:adenosylhomocysteine nucleosidase
MKTLITFAVETEFAPWCLLRGFRRRALSPHPLYEAEVGDTAVRAVITGMGAENASRAMRAALEEEPDVCICSGLAGGLKPAYHSGDILAARRVSEATGAQALEGAAELLRAASACGANLVELFLTSDRVVADSRQKLRLGQVADAVDMESCAVLAEAARWGVPAVAVRAISDTCEMDLPYDFSRAVDSRGQVRVASVLGQVIRRPQGLPALLHLARDARRAAESLAQFLDIYVGFLAAQMSPYELESPVAAT